MYIVQIYSHSRKLRVLAKNTASSHATTPVYICNARDFTKLVRKVITNRAGHQQTVFVNPDKGLHKQSALSSLYDHYASQKIDFPDGLIGQRMVGFRYGAAPEGGRSYNHMTNRREQGVSMAQVAHDEFVDSFAVLNLKEKKVPKYYYEGEIAGTGGDDEILLKNLTPLTYAEYKAKCKEPQIIDTANKIIVGRTERSVFLLNYGYNLGTGVTVQGLRDKAIQRLKIPQVQSHTMEAKQ